MKWLCFFKEKHHISAQSAYCSLCKSAAFESLDALLYKFSSDQATTKERESFEEKDCDILQFTNGLFLSSSLHALLFTHFGGTYLEDQP